MSRRKAVTKRRKRLAIEPLEPRRLLDVSGVWQEMGFRSASGGGITYQPYWIDNSYDKTEGDGGGNHAMAIDSQGRPLAAHTRWDMTTEVVWISVSKFNGFQWVPLGGQAFDAIGSGIDPAIAVDFQDRPYVAWYGAGVGDDWDIYVEHFDGQVWRGVGDAGWGDGSGIGVSDDNVKNAEPDIAIGADGLPIVAYTAYDVSGNDMEVVVKKWDGFQWIELTNGLPFGVTEGVMANLYGGGVSDDIFDSKNPSLTVDRSGYPVLAWSSEAFHQNNEIYVRQWTGGEWAEVGNDSASGPVGKFGDPDTHPSRGISIDDTMSVEPVVRVDNENTIIVGWMDHQDYSNSITNSGIYLKKYEQAGASPSWVEYSPGSAEERGIVGREDMVFENLSMEVGPHSTDPDGLWTPALAWTSFGSDAYNFLLSEDHYQWSEGFVARFNPDPTVAEPWEYLVGDGEDAVGGPYVTDPFDGPLPWSDFETPITITDPDTGDEYTVYPTPDATGWRGYNIWLPGVGIDPNTGHEVLTYSNWDTFFPDREVYIQQYRTNSDYYEVRDLDPDTNVTVSIAWADAPGTPTGDLTISILDADGAPKRISASGEITGFTPYSYQDPVGGNTRGVIRLKVEGEMWGERNYVLTIDQGGGTQNVIEAEPNDVFLKRQKITSAGGNLEARTVVITGSINNQWIEMGRGSMTPGGLDDSPTPSVGPWMATSYEGKPVMAYIDSNRLGEAWLEVKVFEQEARDEFGQPGAWLNLTENAPLTSDVIKGALRHGAEGFALSTIADPLTKVVDVSSDPWILNDLNGKIFVAITDGDFIDVYETEYDPVTQTYSDLVLNDDDGDEHSVVAPTGGKIVWVSVQSGPDGEAALAWEWFKEEGFPLRQVIPGGSWDFFEINDLQEGLDVNIDIQWDDAYTGTREIRVHDPDGNITHQGASQYNNVTPEEYDDEEGEDTRGAIFISVLQNGEGGLYTLTVDQGGTTYVVAETEPNNDMDGRQVISSDSGIEEARTVVITAAYDYPRVGAGDVYAMLWDGSTWDDMQAGSATAPGVYGLGGLTDDGLARWPDLTFVPTPSDPAGTGLNKGGSYVMAWSFGTWDQNAGEPNDPPSDGRYDSGFLSWGIKAAYFDKNTQTWDIDVVDNGDFSTMGYYNLWDPPHDNIIGTYQAQRKWPSITIGDTGRPFLSWTVELYSFDVNKSLDTYDMGGSWIEGWQAVTQGYWRPKTGYPNAVGSSVSHSGIEKERADGSERIDDVLMSTAVGNAGQAPIVTWQALDVDISSTTDDPTRTYIPHGRGVDRIDSVGEDTFYDIWRPDGEAGWVNSAREQRQVFVRRFDEGAGAGWEQMNSRSGVPTPTEFTSASGDGFHGVDQWWSSSFWPTMALTTNPDGFGVNEPVVGWLNDAEQTAYVRGWHHESNMPILTVLESMGTPNDRVLDFGTSLVGTPTTWAPLTIANTGNGDLEILGFHLNSPFEILLMPQHQQQLDENGRILLQRAEEIVVHLRFAPGAEEAASFFDIMEIVSNDPTGSLYPLDVIGVGTTGATIVISEDEGIANDMVLPFGYVEAGQEKQLELTIINEGERTLHLTGIFAGFPGIFEVSDQSLVIQAGQSETITVTYKPENEIPVYDTLAIFSNDLANPRKYLRLVGNAPALFNTSRVTDTGGSDVNPSVSAGYVAYVRTSTFATTGEPSGGIYLYNRLTGEEMEDPIGSGRDPEIWDDWVAFTGGLYDIQQDVLYPLQDIPGLSGMTVSHISVDGNRIAISFEGTGRPIVVLELNRAKLRADGEFGEQVGPGNVVEQVWYVPEAPPMPGELPETYNPAATYDHPSIGGNWIAYRVTLSDNTREATDKMVVLYEYGAENPLLPIQLTPVLGSPGAMIPQLDNHRVVWMDDRWGTDNTQIFMYDVDRQHGYQLTDSASDKAEQFAYDGNLVVWSDYRNGNWDLFAFDLAQWDKDPILAVESQLTFDDLSKVDGNGDPIRYNQMNPAVSGAWIAFQDDMPNQNLGLDDDGNPIEPEITPTQWDVMVGQFPGPPNIGVHEVSGEIDDDMVDFGSVNVDVTEGVGVQLVNTGYGTLTLTNFHLNNVSTNEFELYTYVDANKNLRWDAGEDRDLVEAGDPAINVAVGEYQSLWIEWTPQQIGDLAGDANITVDSNSKDDPHYVVSLTGQGVTTPDMVVSTEMLNFGNAPVGTTASIDVTITNIGNENLVLGDIVGPTSTNAFTITTVSGDKTITPGGVDSYTFRVTFDASIVGTYNETILIYNNDPEHAGQAGDGGYLSLPVHANVVVASDIAVVDSQGVAVTELAYGQVEVGRQKDITLTIRNEGSAPLELTGWTSSNPDVFFVVGGLPTSAIPQGGAAQVIVRFKPAESTSYADGWIQFANNDPDVAGNAWGASTESPYRLEVDDNAQGILAPHIAIEETVGFANDDAINFGTVVISTELLEETFKITNTGSADLHITGWTQTGDSAFTLVGIPGVGAPIAPGESVVVTVRLDASTPGEHSSTLSLTSDDADAGASPYEVTLRANVSAGQVIVTASEIDFGQVESGQTDTREFHIINTGLAPLHVTGVTITGNGFTLTKPLGYDGAFTLGPNETSPAFTVTFSPDGIKDFTGNIQIASGDPVNPTLAEPALAGEGVGIPDLTVVGTTGGKLQFGQATIGESKELTLTLRNDGTETLSLTQWARDNSGDNTIFVISPANPSGSAGDINLAPGETVDVTVIFTPTAMVSYPGVMTIYSNDPDEGQFQILLEGSGTPPEIAGDFDADGQINVSDFDMFSSTFGSSEGDANFNAQMDLDDDGDIDYADLGLLLGYYDDQTKAGASAKTSLAGKPRTPNIDVDVDVDVRTSTVAGNEAANSANDGSGSSQSVETKGSADDQTMLVENLSAALDSGVLDDVARPRVSAPLSTGVEESDDESAGMASGLVVSPDRANDSESLSVSSGLASGLSEGAWHMGTVSGESATGAIDLDGMSEVDSLVAPYADALLPPTNRV